MEQKSGFIDDSLLQDALEKWGFNAQCEMIIEECLELAMALQKMKRLQGDKNQKYKNVIDEIADVKIVIRQAESMFDSELINERLILK